MAGAAAADAAVGRVLGVATDVADTRVEEALAVEVLAVEVLDAPETAGGDGALLGRVGDGGTLGGFGGGEARGAGCEGAEDAREESAGGHIDDVGNEDGDEGDEENCQGAYTRQLGLGRSIQSNERLLLARTLLVALVRRRDGLRGSSSTMLNVIGSGIIGVTPDAKAFSVSSPAS